MSLCSRRHKAGSALIRCCMLKTGWASAPATSSGTTTRRCTITSRCSSGRRSSGRIPVTWSWFRSTKIRRTRQADCVTGKRILRDHANSIDVVLFWKHDPELEAITERWFELDTTPGRRADLSAARSPTIAVRGCHARGQCPERDPYRDALSPDLYFCFFIVKR